MSNKKSIRFQINRLLCLCLALVLSVGLLDFLSIRANALTRDDAVAWARSQEGGGADVDGNGLWCTDLATAYINYCWLRANGDNRNPWGLYPYTTKNGREYDDYLNGNPNWTIINRTSTTVPQPGDLFVSERDSGGKGYGHVGIVLEPYGAGSARVIEMSGGVRPKISTVTWGSTASYNAEHFIRFNYFETHTHSYAQTVTKPTCTEGGYTTYTCSCGSSYRDNYTNALGHDIVYTVSKRPTTAESGTLSGKCSRCLSLIPFGQHQTSLIPDVESPDLYSELRALRLRLSRKYDILPHKIFPDKILHVFARARPRSVPAMLLIEGINFVSVFRYGREFVEEIRLFVETN